MWEDPENLWRRLKLGREEYLQRLLTTLIVGGDPPPWNTPSTPSDLGRAFLRLLDLAAHGTPGDAGRPGAPEVFIDEYRLPKLDDSAPDGWPDWAVLDPARAWVIELKTEAGSHRDDQLPYYLLLAAAAHPDASVDLTYITGPLSKPAPALLPGQRYRHLTWDQVLPLVETVWGDDDRPEVAAYVAMVGMLVENLTALSPSEQRARVLGQSAPTPADRPNAEQAPAAPGGRPASGPKPMNGRPDEESDLLAMARLTAVDGRQRAAAAPNPKELAVLRDTARSLIAAQPADDATRFVLPWVWAASRTGGAAITPEGKEFGYELRLSRYQAMQIKP